MSPIPLILAAIMAKVPRRRPPRVDRLLTAPSLLPARPLTLRDYWPQDEHEPAFYVDDITEVGDRAYLAVATEQAQRPQWRGRHRAPFPALVDVTGAFLAMTSGWVPDAEMVGAGS